MIGSIRRRPGPVLGVVAAALLAGCATYEVRSYPVCNFRCKDGSENRCEIVPDEFGGLQTAMARGNFSTDVIRTSVSSVLIGANQEAHQAIVKLWPQFVCYGPSQSDTQSYYRLLRCEQSSAGWVKTASEKSMTAVLEDRVYRRTCMNASAAAVGKERAQESADNSE